MKYQIKRASAVVLPIAIVVSMVSMPAIASISAESSITGLKFQATKINPALAGNATVSIVTAAPQQNSYNDFTGLTFAADFRVQDQVGNSKLLLPGTVQSYGGTVAAELDATHTSLITEKFENSAAGWSLNAKAVATPGQYADTPAYSSPAYNIASSDILYNGDMYNTVEGGIKISKNTQLTITGAFEAAIRFDATDAPNARVDLDGTANGFIRAAVVPVNEAYSGYPPFGAEKSVSFETSLGYLKDGVLTGQSAFGNNGKQAFTLTLQNTGTTDAWVFFTANTAAAFIQRVSYITTIPEPQSWALMALGMAGLGAAARRLPRRTAAL